MFEFLLAAALFAQPAPPPEPLHLRRNEYGFVVDTPGNPELSTFEFQAEPRSEYGTLDLGIERMMGDEPYEIISLDRETGHVVIRTTDWGGMGIRTGVDLIVHEVTPRVTRIEQRCFAVMAYLGRENPDYAHDRVWDDAPCPPAEALRGGESLIVVGLDAEGRQLWVTSASDPRQHEWETFGAEGASRTTWRNEDDPVWATMRVPLPDDLATLRWFEITRDNELALLGESEWRPAPNEEQD